MENITLELTPLTALFVYRILAESLAEAEVPARLEHVKEYKEELERKLNPEHLENAELQFEINKMFGKNE